MKNNSLYRMPNARSSNPAFYHFSEPGGGIAAENPYFAAWKNRLFKL
jgi:hypothetical protein